MRYETVVFEEVTVRGQKAGKCLCGKRRTRSQTFTHTINPFNKNPDGTIRTRDEIYPRVMAERDAWMEEPITCDNCRP